MSDENDRILRPPRRRTAVGANRSTGYDIDTGLSESSDSGDMSASPDPTDFSAPIQMPQYQSPVNRFNAGQITNAGFRADHEDMIRQQAREDEQKRTLMGRNQQLRRVEQARQQKAAEKAQADKANAEKKVRNSEREADFRSRDVEFYTDAFGDLQPVLDEKTKQPVFKERVSDVQYDPSTGKPLQTKRDRAGAVTVIKPDADAPIEENKDDSTDRYIYRKNKLSAWDAIDPEEGIKSEDMRVKVASAKALHKRELQDLERQEHDVTSQLNHPDFPKALTDKERGDLEEERTALAQTLPQPEAKGGAWRVSEDDRKNRLGEVVARLKADDDRKVLYKQAWEIKQKLFSAKQGGAGGFLKRWQTEEARRYRDMTPEEVKITGEHLAAQREGLETEARRIETDAQELQQRAERGLTAAELEDHAVRVSGIHDRMDALNAQEQQHNEELQKIQKAQDANAAASIRDAAYAARERKERLNALKSDPNTAAFAEKLEGLDVEAQARATEIEKRYPAGSRMRQIAVDALEGDMRRKQSAVLKEHQVAFRAVAQAEAAKQAELRQKAEQLIEAQDKIWEVASQGGAGAFAFGDPVEKLAEKVSPEVAAEAGRLREERSISEEAWRANQGYVKLPSGEIALNPRVMSPEWMRKGMGDWHAQLEDAENAGDITPEKRILLEQHYQDVEKKVTEQAQTMVLDNDRFRDWLKTNRPELIHDGVLVTDSPAVREAASRFLATEPGVWTAVYDKLGRFIEGAIQQTAADLAIAAGVMSNTLSFGAQEIEDNFFYQLGQGARENIRRQQDPRMNDSGWSQLATGIGSVAGFMLPTTGVGVVAKAGVAAKLAKAAKITNTAERAAEMARIASGSEQAIRRATTIGVMTQGGLQQGAQLYEEAREAGLDHNHALLPFVLGGLIGTSETIPIGKFIERVAVPKRMAAWKAVTNMLVEVLEGFSQEGFQQLSSNAVARMIYDKNRDLLDGVMGGALAGGEVGAIVSLLSSAIGNARVRSRRKNGQSVANNEEEEDRTATPRYLGILGLGRYAQLRGKEAEGVTLTKDESMEKAFLDANPDAAQIGQFYGYKVGEKSSDEQLPEKFDDRYPDGKPPTISIQPEEIAVAQAEVEEKFPPGAELTPEQAQKKALLSGLIKISQGKPHETLTAEERASVETPGPDGVARVEKVNGKHIVTDNALRELSAEFPETAKLFRLNETEARERAIGKKTAEAQAEPQEPQGAQGAQWTAQGRDGTAVSIPASEAQTEQQARVKLAAKLTRMSREAGKSVELLDTDSIEFVEAVSENQEGAYSQGNGEVSGQPTGDPERVHRDQPGRTDGPAAAHSGGEAGVGSGAHTSQGGNQNPDQDDSVRDGAAGRQSDGDTAGRPVAREKVSNPQPGNAADVDTALGVLEGTLERMASRLGLPPRTFRIKSVPGTPLQAALNDAGDIFIEYDPEEILSEANTRHEEDGGHGPKYIEDAFNEELTHIAQFQDAKEQWEKAGRPGGLVAFHAKLQEARLNEVEAEIDRGGKDGEAVANALIKAYANYKSGGRDVPMPEIPGDSPRAKAKALIRGVRDGTFRHGKFMFGGWRMQAEFLRAVIQARRRGDLSETGYRRVVGRLLEWMRSLVEKLRAIGDNPVIAGQIKRTEELLDMAVGWSSGKPVSETGPPPYSPDNDTGRTIRRSDAPHRPGNVVENGGTDVGQPSVPVATTSGGDAAAVPVEGDQAGNFDSGSNVSIKKGLFAQLGEKDVAYTDNNDPVSFLWAVAELDDLVISNTETGSVNHAYPQQLQPRDRSSAGSLAQVADIASNANFDRLSVSENVGNGAPIIGPGDGVVESGNGRLMGLRQAYQQKLQSIEKYRKKLAENAKRFGLNGEKIAGMKRPVLVRVRQTPLDRQVFVQVANVSNVSPMREVEVARVDASKITPGLFELFRPAENGSIFTPDNQPFITAFAKDVIPQGERAAVIDGRGVLSQTGLRRIRNALFVYAYGDSPEALNALGRMTEDIDADGKNITNAMLAISSVIANQNADVKAGKLHNLGIAKDIVVAVQTLVDIRNRGGSVSGYLLQGQMFPDGVTPFQKDILQFLDKNKRSAKRIIEAFRRYSEALDALGDPRQDDFLAKELPTRESIWNLVKEPPQDNALYAARRSTPGETRKLYKVYNRLFNMQRSGVELSAEQSQTLESLERKLGQMFLFDESRGRRDTREDRLREIEALQKKRLIAPPIVTQTDMFAPLGGVDESGNGMLFAQPSTGQWAMRILPDGSIETNPDYFKSLPTDALRRSEFARYFGHEVAHAADRDPAVRAARQAFLEALTPEERAAVEAWLDNYRDPVTGEVDAGTAGNERAAEALRLLEARAGAWSAWQKFKAAVAEFLRRVFGNKFIIQHAKKMGIKPADLIARTARNVMASTRQRYAADMRQRNDRLAQIPGVIRAAGKDGRAAMVIPPGLRDLADRISRPPGAEPSAPAFAGDIAAQSFARPEELLKDESGEVIGVRPDVLADIRREEDEIEEAAIASGQLKQNTDGTWTALAPNGQKSNLTKEQWVTVRTARFKEWFGDWEAVGLRRRVTESTLFNATTEGLTETGEAKDLRQEAVETYSGPEIVTNTATRNTIRIEPSGISNSLKHGVGIQKRAVVKVLDGLLQDAVFVARDTKNMKQGVRSVETYAGRVMVDGQPFIARLVVREVSDGRRFYDHELSSFAPESARPAGYSGGSEGAFTHRRSKLQTRASLGKTLLDAALSVNPDSVSKVVDTNGEPMVVYHGTHIKNKFRVFGENYDPGGWRHEFWFADMLGAESHAKGRFGAENAALTEVFLNIKNPGDPMDRSDLVTRRRSDMDGVFYAPGKFKGSGSSPGGRAWIAFNSNQIKSATANEGTFSPETGRNDYAFVGKDGAQTLDSGSRTPDFYSQLERVIEAKMPNAASAEQVKAIIDPAKGGGVKAEEIKWSGVVPWLESQGGKVGKADLLEYLRNEGAVKFEEVTEKDGPVSPESLYDEVAQNEYEASFDELSDRGQDYVRYLAEERAKVKSTVKTKYGDYQLPGGEDYREVILTMPSSDADNARAEYETWARNRGMNPLSTEAVKAYEGLYGAVPKKTAAYTSSHFPQIPNYVAHMRVNEREGGLFIEEIQSDRHQEGREKGYQGQHAVPMVEDKTDTQALVAGRWTHRSIIEEAGVDFDTLEVGQSVPKLADQAMGAPDAPFRSTWPLQMFKRALRDAVASGKQWIGWTTGETQAERYDLSKQVDSIGWIKDGDGVSLTIEKEGEDITGDLGLNRRVQMNELPGIIGKDAARKIEDGDERGKLEGESLKVGGEGMKGFYDNILPKEVAKYIKQWGGKVELGELADGTKFWKAEITPQMREGVKQGQPRFSRSRGLLAWLDRGISVADKAYASADFLPASADDRAAVAGLGGDGRNLEAVGHPRVIGPALSDALSFLDALGKTAVFVRAASSEASAPVGVFDSRQPNKVFLRVGVDTNWRGVAAHEVVHAMEVEAPGLYRALTDYVRASIGENGYARFAEARRREDYFGKEIENELAARTVEWVLTDPAAMARAAGRNPTLFEQLVGFLQRMLDSVMARIGSRSDLRRLHHDLTQAREAVATAMDAFRVNAEIGKAINSGGRISGDENSGKLFSASRTPVDEKRVASYFKDNGTPENKVREESERVLRAIPQHAGGRLAESGTVYQAELFAPQEETIGQKTERAVSAALQNDSSDKNAKDGRQSAGVQADSKPSADLVAGLKGDWQALSRELDAKGRASSILADLVDRRIPAWDVTGTKIETPEDVLAVMQPIRSPYFESLKVMVLDGNDNVVSSQILHVGSLNESIASPVMIFGHLTRLREATGRKYNRIILSHNHPGGDPTPSPADHAVTKRLRAVVERTGFNLVDHVITNGETYFSFRAIGGLDSDSTAKKEREYKPRKDTASRPQRMPEMAGWEILKRSDLVLLDHSRVIAEAAKFLRNGNTDSAHVIFLNTRLRLTAVERVPLSLLDDKQEFSRYLLAAGAREGAHSFVIEKPGEQLSVKDREQIRWISTFSSDSMLRFVDMIITDSFANAQAVGVPYVSAKDIGVMEQPGQGYGHGILSSGRRPNPYRNEDGTIKIPERASSKSDPALATYEAKLRRLVDDQKEADRRYDALPDAKGGKVIGTDIARELLPEFAASREGKIRFTNATGHIGQAYAKDRLWREIENPRGRDKLMFTAGGVAAGKSTAVKDSVVAYQDLVFDGTLRETDWAIQTIERALEKGWNVRIAYVQRPIPLVIRGAIYRAINGGRWGAVSELPAIHQSAQKSIIRLAKHFAGNPNVDFQFYLNDGTSPDIPSKELTLKQIDVGGPYSYSSSDEQRLDRGREAGEPGSIPAGLRGRPAQSEPRGSGVVGEVQRSGTRGEEEGISDATGQGGLNSGIDPEATAGGFAGAATVRQVFEEVADAERNNLAAQEVLDLLAQGDPELERIAHSLNSGKRSESQEASPDHGKAPGELVKENMGLAVTIANDYRNIPGVSFDDVLQQARVALVRAAQGYDASRGVPFGVYAGRAMRNELNGLYGKQDRIRSREEVSLDEPLGEEGATRGDLVAAPKDGPLPIEKEETAAVIESIVAKLPKRPQAIVRGFMAGKTGEETARELGITRQAVSASLNGALGVLRQQLKMRGLEGQEDGVLFAARRGRDADNEFQEFLEALRRDMPTVEDMEALRQKAQAEPMGQRTVGDPRLAKSAQDDATRIDESVVQQFYRDQVDKRTFDEYRAGAKKILDADEQGVKRHLLDRALRGLAFETPELVVAAQMLIPRLLRQANLRNDRQAWLDAMTLKWADQSVRGDTARTLGAMHDPHRSPVERHMEFIAGMFARLDPAAEKYVAAAVTPQQREQRLNRELDKRMEKIEAALKEMGLTVDDLFAHDVRSSILKTAISRNAIANLSQRDALMARHIMDGFSDKEIAKAMGTTVEAVQQGRQVFDAALDKEIVAYVEQDLSDEAFASVSALFASARSRMTDAQFEAFRNKIRRQIRPDAETANKKKRPPKTKKGPLPKNATPEERKYHEGQPWQYTSFDVKDKYQVARLLDAVHAKVDADWFAKGREYVLAALLWGPQTQVVNVLGNAANFLWEYFLHKPIEAGIAELFGTTQHTQGFGALMSVYKSMRPAFWKAWEDAAKNREFRDAFTLKVLGGAENITARELERRIELALFSKAYGSTPEGHSAFLRLSGETDDDIRTITQAMFSVAPDLVRLQTLIAEGAAYPLDIAPDVARAAQDISEALRNKPAKQRVAEALDGLLNQPGLFDDLVPPVANQVLRFMVKNRRNKARILEALGNYVDAVALAGDPRQANLFDLDAPSKEGMWQVAERKMNDTLNAGQRFPSDQRPPVRNLFRIYNRLFNMNRGGVQLNEGQRALMERAERELSQSIMFDMDTHQPRPRGKDQGRLFSGERARFADATRVVYAEAERQREGFLNDLRAAARQSGVRFYEPQAKNALKKLTPALSKLNRKLAIPSDLLRGTIISQAQSPDGVRANAVKFVEKMAAMGYRLYAPGGKIDVDDRFADPNPGYKDIALKFVKDREGYTDPVVKEVLVSTDGNIRLKKAMHAFYRIQRKAEERLQSGSYLPGQEMELEKTRRKMAFQIARLGESVAFFNSSPNQRFKSASSSESISLISSGSGLLRNLSKNASSDSSSASDRAFIYQDNTAKGAGRKPFSITTTNIPGIPVTVGEKSFLFAGQRKKNADHPDLFGAQNPEGNWFPGGEQPGKVRSNEKQTATRRKRPFTGRHQEDEDWGAMGGLFDRLAGHREAQLDSGVSGGQGRFDFDAGSQDGQLGQQARSGDGRLGGDGTVVSDVGGRDGGLGWGQGGRGDREAEDVRVDAGGTGSTDRGTGSKRRVADKRIERPSKGEAGRNFEITPETSLSPRGVVSKLKANIAALRIIKAIEDEGRQATPEEKAELVRFSGWGALSQAFDDEKADRIARGEIETRRETAQRYRDYGSTYAQEVENQEKDADALENWRDKWLEAHKEISSLLTEAEYRDAKRSTINAHYTSPEVISGMWDMARWMGFNGGNVLEPGAGIGHFFGLMPEAIADRSRLFGVELDSYTARILQALYPEANIQNTAFQTAEIADNSIDLAISNVPFANVPVVDKALEAMGGPTDNLHDYFFGKALTKLKPGGIQIFITSAFTMDKGNPEIRKWLSERADLVAAYRLPNDAFRENAGTDVVTDIIVLRKKDGKPFAQAQEWSHLGDAKTRGGEMIRVNQYFAKNPQNILGLLDNDGKMFAGRETGKKEMTVHSDPSRPAVLLLKQALESLPRDVFGASTEAATPVRVALSEAKIGNITEKDGRFYFHGQEEPDAELNSPKNRAKVGAYIAVRDALNRQYDLEMSESSTNEEIESNRKILNTAYDAFSSKFRNFHDKKNKALLIDDADFFRVLGAEVEATRDKGILAAVGAIVNKILNKDYVKADIFRKRVMEPRVEPTTADSVEDAFGISLGWRGIVDVGFMASLTGNTPEQIEKALLEGEIAIRDPETGQILTREQYLSGNVRKKLEVARASGPEYRRNVELLEAVQPEEVSIDDIQFGIGATWIPAQIYSDFLGSLGISNVKFDYVEGKSGSGGDRWYMDAKKARYSGTEYKDFQTNGISTSEIVEHFLNFRPISINKKDENENTVQDVAATAAARDVGKKLAQRFTDWARSDAKIAETLAETYNREVNSRAQRAYDGQFLAIPWLAKGFDFYPDKKNTVWRAIQDGFGLIAHGVGGGKTLLGSAIALEMRRLGMARKPMIVVHNATLEGFASEIAKIAPTARVLVGRKDELQGAKRKEFLMRIAAGDWDAVVIAHSTFGLIEDDPQIEISTMEALADEMMDSLKSAGYESVHEATKDRQKTPTVKNLIKQIERLETDIKKASTRKVDKGLLNFQQLGVDALIVDEVHKFKKMPFATKLNVKGIDGTFSQRGYSLMLRAREIQKRMGGKNVFTMTGTPVTNTLGEVWNMVRLVAPHLLKEYKIQHFDQFVSKFAKVETKSEMGPGGDFKNVERLSSIINLPEWATFLRLAADVKLGDDMVVKDRPEIKGGKAELVAVPRSEAVGAWVNFVRSKLDAFSKLSGNQIRENPKLGAIPVQAYMASRAAAIDIRLIDPRAKDEPGSKVNVMLDRLMEIYERTSEYNGTQVVFADSFNTQKIGIFDEIGGGNLDIPIDPNIPPGTKFNLYEDIRSKLIARGVPANEIAVITDSKYGNDKTKQALFEAVNEGTVRIIIGSTERLGTGVNMQERMAAGHHLDVPWTPAELEQRDGRVYRQGNIHAEMGGIELIRYGMKDTLDAALWQKLETKQRFITGALSGKITGRSLDESEEIMSLAEQRAVLSGPHGQRLFELETRLQELERSKAGHRRESESRIREIESARNHLRIFDALNERVRPFIERMREVGRSVGEKGATISVGGKTFPSKAATAEAVDAALKASRDSFALSYDDKVNVPPVFSIGVNGVPIYLSPKVSYVESVPGDGITRLVPRVDYYLHPNAASAGEEVDFGRVTSAGTLSARLEELTEMTDAIEAGWARNSERLRQLAEMKPLTEWEHQKEYDESIREIIDVRKLIGNKPTTSSLEGDTLFSGQRFFDLGLYREAGEFDFSDQGNSPGDLVKKNIALANFLANRYRNIAGVELDDVVQQARLALIKAARAYDSGHGVPFGAYASRAIRNELNSLFGRQLKVAKREIVSLDEPIGEDGDETLHDVTAESTESDALPMEHEETRRILDGIIARLPDRPQTIVRNFMSGMSGEETAKELGISRQAVNASLRGAQAVIRQQLREMPGPSPVVPRTNRP